MKRLNWLTMLVLLCAAPVVTVMAQDAAVILQMTVPFFAEDLLVPVIEQFEAENPGVQVLLLPYGGFGLPVEDSDDPEEYLDNLADYFSSADILFINNDITPEATRAGYLLDLSPLTQSDPAFNAAAFHPTVLPSFMWDGRQWALPISTNFVVLSYIPEAFDNAGLAYPNENWTLADLDFAARVLTQYDADGSIALNGLLATGGGGDNLAALFASLAGGRAYNDTSFPSVPEFSNPQLEADLTTWQALQADGILTLPEDVDSDLVPILIENPQGFGGGFGGNQDDPERATALLPGGYAGLNANGYAVSSGTLYPTEAYELIKFLISNPNAITASLGTLPALQQPPAPDTNQGGIGGFLANATSVPDELAPLLDTALARGLNIADRRFTDGIITAYNLMQSDGLDAQTALITSQTEITVRLTAADNRAATPIVVQAPNLPTELVAGEIALDFAVLGGGPGFAISQQWQDIADRFVAADPQVGRIVIEPEPQFQFDTVVENYDCLYANNNLVPDVNLDLLLSLDPLVSTDPAFDSSDFVAGIFEQVRVNNQLWALPLQISPLVLRFDYEVYNQAGVIIPQGTWSVSEFEDTLRQIQFVLAEDEHPLEFNQASQSALLSLIAIYGGVPFDTRTDPPTVNFTDPNTVNAMQQVLELARVDLLDYATGGGGPGGGGGGNANADVPTYSNILNAFVGGGGPGGSGNAQANDDGLVTFPRGNQFNAVTFNLGTLYISATAEQPEACYRFFQYLMDSPDLFQSMPVRLSQINSPAFATARGTESVVFFQSLADLMSQPSTLLFPTNINTGNFGMTNWLFNLFERYLNDEVVDFEADLQDAEQITRAYLDCINAIPTDNLTQGRFGEFFQQVQACQAAVDPNL